MLMTNTPLEPNMCMHISYKPLLLFFLMENKIILYYCWLLSLRKSFTTAAYCGRFSNIFMLIGITDEHWRANITLGFYPTSAHCLQHCPIRSTFLYLNYSISVPSCPVMKAYLQSCLCCLRGFENSGTGRKPCISWLKKMYVLRLFSQSLNFKLVGFVNSHWFVLDFHFWRPCDLVFPLVPCWQFWQALKKLWAKAKCSSEME